MLQGFSCISFLFKPPCMKGYRNLCKSHNFTCFFTKYSRNKILLNRDLNRGCLVYMFSLRFPGSKFLMNLGGNFVHVKFFCVRKIFRTHGFAGFTVF